jgi:hypothetical protein
MESGTVDREAREVLTGVARLWWLSLVFGIAPPVGTPGRSAGAWRAGPLRERASPGRMETVGIEPTSAVANERRLQA